MATVPIQTQPITVKTTLPAPISVKTGSPPPITVQNVSRPVEVEIAEPVPVAVSVALTGPPGADSTVPGPTGLPGKSTFSYGTPWEDLDIGESVLASWDNVDWMFAGICIYVGSQNTRQLVGYFQILSVDPVNCTSLLLRVPTPRGSTPEIPNFPPGPPD